MATVHWVQIPGSGTVPLDEWPDVFLFVQRDSGLKRFNFRVVMSGASE